MRTYELSTLPGDIPWWAWALFALIIAVVGLLELSYRKARKLDAPLPEVGTLADGPDLKSQIRGATFGMSSSAGSPARRIIRAGLLALVTTEAFNEAIAYVRGLDEQDQQALTAADALAAAVEAHSFAFSDDTALAILSALAEYRKVRPQEAK